MIDKSVIEQIKSRIMISELVSRYIPVEERYGRKKAVCPFHEDKNPSMFIDDGSGTFHCFGCGESGDIFGFLQKIEKLSFAEALAKLAAECGIELRRDDGKYAAEKKEKDLLREMNSALEAEFCDRLRSAGPGAERARNYLSARHVDDRLIREFRLGYAPPDRNFIYDFLRRKGYSDSVIGKSGLVFSGSRGTFFTDRLMFPVHGEDGRPMAFSGRTLCGDDRKYVNSSETPLYRKKESFYGFYQSMGNLRKKGIPVICEGNFDAIAMHAAGVGSALATCGTALTDSHASVLRRFSDTALLFFDRDDAGVKATSEAAVKLISHGVRSRVMVMDGYKDASEAREKAGDGFLAALPEKAVRFEDFLLGRLLSTVEASSISYKREVVSGFREYSSALQSDMDRAELARYLSERLSLDEPLVAGLLSEGRVSRPAPQKPVQKVSADYDAMGNSPRYETDLMKLLLVKRRHFYDTRLRGINYMDFRSEKARVYYRLIAECSDEAMDSDDIFIEEISDEGLREHVRKEICSSQFAGYDGKKLDSVIREALDRMRRAGIRDDMKSLGNFSKAVDDEGILKEKAVKISEFMRIDTAIRQGGGGDE